MSQADSIQIFANHSPLGGDLTAQKVRFLLLRKRSRIDPVTGVACFSRTQANNEAIVIKLLLGREPQVSVLPLNNEIKFL